MTNVIEITSAEWQLIASTACSFQVLGQREIKITEQASKPDVDSTNYKIALPKEMYSFTPNGGNLYALSISENSLVGYEL